MIFSVVVPVYNGEKYLEECLLSLVEQTDETISSENYEIIVVNDGSTDKTEEIIDKFLNDYTYIKKINKPNEGVSSARNSGLENAIGEFVTFVDADDRIATNVFVPVLKFIIENELDGFLFGVSRNEKNANIKLTYDCLKQLTTICPPERMAGIHGMIFKRSILTDNKIVFNTSMAYQEDLLFYFNYIKNIKTMGINNLPLYIYRNNENSVTANFFTKRTAYGDATAKEYKCYSSRILFLKAMREYYLLHSENEMCKRVISIMMSELLLFAMRSMYSPEIVLEDIRKNSLSLKDINVKYLDKNSGNKIKLYVMRFLKWCFKSPVLYIVLSKMYCWFKR